MTHLDALVTMGRELIDNLDSYSLEDLLKSAKGKDDTLALDFLPEKYYLEQIISHEKKAKKKSEYFILSEEAGLIGDITYRGYFMDPCDMSKQLKAYIDQYIKEFSEKDTYKQFREWMLSKDFEFDELPFSSVTYVNSKSGVITNVMTNLISKDVYVASYNRHPKRNRAKKIMKKLRWAEDSSGKLKSQYIEEKIKPNKDNAGKIKANIEGNPAYFENIHPIERVSYVQAVPGPHRILYLTKEYKGHVHGIGSNGERITEWIGWLAWMAAGLENNFYLMKKGTGAMINANGTDYPMSYHADKKKKSKKSFSRHHKHKYSVFSDYDHELGVIPRIKSIGHWIKEYGNPVQYRDSFQILPYNWHK